MKKVLPVVLIIFFGVALAGGIIYFSLPTNEDKSEERVLPTGQTKEFNLELFNWDFEPKTIVVNAGDMVKLNVTTRDIDHGIGINEFLVNKRVQPGQITKVEFLANKRGEFRMYCTVVCGEGHFTMDGKLIVK